MVRNIPGIDRSTTRKLKRGKFAVDATLDLHGMGREGARDAVLQAVQKAYRAGQRCLLIITGKGEILRPALKEWLAYDEVVPHVLTCQEAAPEHGGAGAFYVLIRRRRV